MTSQYTPRLGLMKPVGSDDFLLQDFVDTFTALDAAPGLFVCLSSSRPASWGSNQVGRTILETDTGRIMRWTGSAWTGINQFAYTSQLSAAPGVTVAASGTQNVSLGTFTPARAGRAIIWGRALFSQVGGDQQIVTGTVKVNGSAVTFGSDTLRWGGVSAGNARTAMPIMGYANVTTAAQALSFTADVGSLSTSGVVLNDVKAFVMLAE